MSDTASKSIYQIRNAIETNLSSSELKNTNWAEDIFVDDFSFRYDDSVVKNLVEDLQRNLDSAELDVKVDLDSIELGVESVETGGVLSVIKSNTERISNSLPKFSGKLRSDTFSGDNSIASSTINTDEIIAQLEQEQLRAVEKFNEARSKGLDITKSLTQDELALTRAYYEGLRVEKERSQERAKQQRNEKFNANVDKVVASTVIDLPKEESKIERLNSLAKEVKADFANEAEISQVKSKFGELKRLASEIKIELTYNNNLSTISNQLGTLKKAAEGIRFNFSKTGDIEQANKGVEALKNKISELKAKRDSLNDAYEKGIISEIEFRADTADIDKTIDELESETVQIEADIKASESFNLSGIVDNLSGKIGLVKGVFSTTVDIMKKLFEFSDYMVGKFKEAVDTAKKLGSALNKVASLSFDISRGILEFSHNALDALGITEKLNDTMSSIGFGDLVGADLLSDAIRELSGALKGFSKDALESGSSFQSYYLKISDIFGESKDVIYDYAKSSTEMLGMSETAYMEAASKIGVFAKAYISDTEDLTNVTAGLTTAIADLSAQTGFTIDETMTKLLSGIRGNTEAIEELGINVKVADLQTWLDTQGINADFEKLNSTMQNLYRTWYILDKVQSNGTMGYASKMMNTYSGQVRILQAQLDSLKTTIGTYLMQALVPVLKLANMLLSRLIDIANMVGKAFGLLDKYSFAESLGTQDASGVSDIYDDATNSISGATKAQEDLAKSTEKSAKAAKKALAPFHKLNILQKNDSPKSSKPNVPDIGGLGGLGSAIKATPKLDTKPIDKEVSEWLKAFKKAIKDGDWYEVGHLLGQKVNEIVDKLDFKKYTDKFEKGAKNLAKIFNGLIETINFEAIGTKLGDGVNLIAHTINTFLDEINFEEVGTSISDLLRSFMATADWEEIGKLWSQKTRILLDILHGFVEDMSEINPDTDTNGWQELGNSLGKFVNSALDLEWERLGTDIGKAINGVADTIISFNKTVDLVGISTRLATGFNNLVDELDGEKIGKAISDTINSAISSVGTFLKKANFRKLGIEIGNAIGTALANINWDDAADTVIAIANGIVSLLEGAVKSLSQNYDKIFEGVESFATSIIDWINDPKNQDAIADVINDFTDMLVGLVSTIDWDRLYEGISKTLSKIDWEDIIYLLHLGDGVKMSLSTIFAKENFSAVINLLGELVRDIFKPLIDTVGRISWLFGSIIGKFIAIGYQIVTGLWEGISSAASWLYDSVTGFFKSIVDWVKSIFGIESHSTVFSEIGNFLIEGLLNGIKEKWEEFKEFFTVKIPELISDVKEKFNGFKDAISEVWDRVKESTSEKWASLKEFFTVKIPELISHVKEKFSGFKEAISEVWDKVKEGTSTKWNEIKDTIVGVFSTIANGIKSPINTIISFIEAMVNGIISGINAAIGALNRFSVEVPSWVPEYGGQKFGFSIPTLNNVSIPRLAQGAVIKPNQRFLAELGDQTRGINIEAPLETIKSGVRDVLGEFSGYNNGDLTAYIYLGNDLLEEKVVEIVKDNTFRSNGR